MERAETYLRLLAERELRQRNGLERLWHAAAVLVEADALTEEVTAKIVESAGLALAVRSLENGSTPPYSLGVPRGPFGPANGGGPWHVTPVGRIMAGRTGPILVSALVRTPDAVFLAAMRPSGDPVPLDDIVALSAADDTGTTYTLSRTSPAAIEFDPPPPAGVRSLTIFDLGTERIQLHPSATPPAPEAPGYPAGGSAAERLLTRRAEQLLTVAARGQETRLGAGLPGRRAGALAPEAPLGETVEILRAVGLLSPDSPVPARLAALCEHLNLPADGLPSPADLPAAWRSVLTQYRRLSPQPARGDTFVTPLAMPLPDLDGLRVLLTGLCGSHLHLVVLDTLPHRPGGRGWTRAGWYAASPVVPGASGPPLSVWALDDGGSWHLADTERLRPETQFMSAELRFLPPLGRDVSELELTATGRTTSTTVTIEVRD